MQFDRYSARYRKGLDLVLKGISCDIRGGEKVSRTGGGDEGVAICCLCLVYFVENCTVMK